MGPDGERASPAEASREYGAALIDWLACACAGAGERAATAVRESGDDLLADVAFAAAAGHVLDFDDTFAEAVVHLSAACAPAALVPAAHLGLSLGSALDAYAAGFEAMAELAAASHPALYERGWHPTAVCAPLGAAAAACSVLELTELQRENAITIALLRAGGTRGAFGTDGKAIQVGLAAAAGVQAALLARAGARVDRRAIDGPLGFDAVLGAACPRAGAERRAGAARARADAEPPADVARARADADPPAGAARAIERNWIKLHPSCLGTHSPIDAAAEARSGGYRVDHPPGRGELEVRVHPLALQAAHLDIVSDGLSAKFSIPYCTAYTLIHGPPQVADFAELNGAADELSRRVKVRADASLPDFGALLMHGEEKLAQVSAPRGSPERPLTAEELAGKVEQLAGARLDGLLADLDAPAADALSAAGLMSVARS